jgi:serine/threonine protein kinase
VRESGDAPYFTLSNLKKISRSILEALSFVHGLGLIHCDVKVWHCVSLAAPALR